MGNGAAADTQGGQQRRRRTGAGGCPRRRQRIAQPLQRYPFQHHRAEPCQGGRHADHGGGAIHGKRARLAGGKVRGILNATKHADGVRYKILRDAQAIVHM